MSEIIYFFCAITSAFCAVLLIRGYRLRKSRLLFWSSLYFCGQALTNALLVLDLVVLPEMDMSFMRRLVTFSATTLFLMALIGEVE
jgi:hypothetical protein